MQTRNLARLLSLAVASHQSGNNEDSHDIFEMFLQEVAAAEDRDAETLLPQIEQVIASALSHSDIPETVVEQAAEEALATSDNDEADLEAAALDEDDIEINRDVLATSSFFDQVEDHLDEEDVAGLMEESEERNRQVIVMKNLEALRRPRTAA